MLQKCESQHAFSELLTEIEQLLEPEIVTTLCPPASERDFLPLEQKLGAPLPMCLRQLLLWHDGQGWNSPLRESDNRRLLTVSEISDALDFFLDPEEDFCQPWGRYWVPFLTNDSGDYVVVDASPMSTGALIAYWHDWDNRPVVDESLPQWAAGLKEELIQNQALTKQ